MRQSTLLKIIEILRKNMDGLTILDISKKLKIGYRPAYNHIAEMEKEKIINVKKVGNAKLCTLNIPSQKTKRLLAESVPEFPILSALISNLTENYINDIHSIILFGSHAKGTAIKTSDYDILFIIHDIKDKDIRDSIERKCAEYRYSHSITVSPMITDIKEFQNMLKSKEINIGIEAKNHGITVYGSEIFWKLCE